MTKEEVIRNLADENRKIFREKVKLGHISMESEKFSEIGGKSETEGNASLPKWGGRPWQ